MSISQLGSFSNEYITSELYMPATQSAFGGWAVCVMAVCMAAWLAVLCWLAVHPAPPLLLCADLQGVVQTIPAFLSDHFQVRTAGGWVGVASMRGHVPGSVYAPLVAGSSCANGRPAQPCRCFQPAV